MKYGLDEINLNLISIGMKFLFIKKKKKKIDFGIRHISRHNNSTANK